MRDAGDLAVTHAYDLTRRQFDRLMRSGNNTGWCWQRTGVQTLPDHLQHRSIAARQLTHECCPRVRYGARPALPSLDNLALAPNGTVCSYFVVQSICSEQVLDLAPILFVVS